MQWEQRVKIVHRYIFKGKPLQWCLGVQAFACTTWKRSTCCCLCQTEMFPLMYQFYHMDFPILLRAQPQHYSIGTSFWQGPACGLSSKTTPGLILWDLLELLAFKILYHPSERTIHAFWWTTQPSFCYSVVYSEGGKEKTEDREQHSHAGVFIYLTFKSKLFAELSQLLWRQAWRSCYTMATAMDWLCCLKHTHLESI